MDDDPNLGVGICRILNSAGMETIYASTGSDGLMLAQQHKPDLVLCDVNLPDMDGYEVCKAIKSDSDISDTYVALISSMNTDSDLQSMGLEIGADGYICRPIPNRELLARVTSLLRLKNIEKDLQRSQQRYRLLADYNHDWEFWIAPDGSFEYVSPSCERITGYKAKDFIENPALLREMIHPEDASAIREHFACVDSGGPCSVDFRIFTSDGEDKWISHECQAVFDEKGGWLGRRGNNRDITERKQVELKLRTHEERLEEIVDQVTRELRSTASRLQDLIDTSSDWMWELNDRFEFTYVSPRVTEVLGFTDSEIIGKTLGHFMRPAEAERVENIMRQHASQRIPFSFLENVCLHKEGPEVFLETSAVPLIDENKAFLGYRGTARDITRRKKTEAALRDSEQTLKTIMSTSPVAIALVNERKLVWINDHGSRMFGYESVEEIVGQDSAMVFDSDVEYQRVGKELYVGLDHDRIAQTTAKFSRKDGSLLYGKIRAKLLDPSSSERLVLIVISDVTDELLAEQERAAIQARYLQAQKMEAIGVLASGIYHDFNNLLQIILGNVDLIQNDQDLKPPCRANADAISSAAERGAELVKSLMAFSRKSSANFQPINLNDQVRHITKMLSRTISKMIVITTELGPDLQTVEADPTQMGQVLMNLAVNACDAMGDSGRISIKTSNVFLDEKFCRSHVLAKPGNHVMLTFSDTGCGMDSGTLEHVFEPFFTTKESGKGTGLGLATVYGIIKQTKGFIDCESEPGKGTTFRIYLPAAQQQIKASPKTSVEEAPLGGNETILFVEDDDSVRGMVADMMGQAGYNVLEASNGRTGLDVYRKEADRIDLVLLDIMMPEMGGVECLDEILRIRPEARVIMATGIAPNDDRTRQALETGARAVYHKPLKLKSLLKAVRDALDKV